MFRKYHQKFWHRKRGNRRQNLFQPENITMKKIKAVDNAIKRREKIEQDNFDKAFAAELAKL